MLAQKLLGTNTNIILSLCNSLLLSEDSVWDGSHEFLVCLPKKGCISFFG